MAEDEREPRETQAGSPEEELLEALDRLRVDELLVQMLVSVSSLGFAKLEPGRRDLDQARLAVEALRVLLPLLEESVDADLVRDLRGALSSLQLAYSRAVQEERPGDAEPG